MQSLARYAKAVVGALVAGFTALDIALDDDVVTASEWVTVALATLAALGVVWAVPNAPAGTHQAESVQPPEAGETALGVALTVLIVLVIVLLLLRIL